MTDRGLAAAGPILSVTGLRVETRAGAPVIEDVEIDLGPGEVLGLVGESGSGKTTLALALLGYARPGLSITGGSVRVAGQELLHLPEEELRRIRGRSVSYVPQDPAKSLNPGMRVADQLREVMDVHLPGAATPERVASTLERVSLPSGTSFQRRYTHQLSGGQQQRLAIAIALACDAQLLVLDEPTTGLDVVTQARILDEVARICSDSSVSAVFVSHDLAALATIASQIAVMYAGQVVEQGSRQEVIGRPRHPYTSGLISSVPVHDRPATLHGIPGTAVGVEDRPPGCRFAPRCALATDRCAAATPSLAEAGMGHLTRCWHWQQTPPVLHTPRVVSGAQQVRTPLLEVRHLGAAYGTRRHQVAAVRDVCFAIEPAECLALVGESGSGKSTIARCVAGLHRPSAGEIAFDGAALPPTARKRSRDSRRRIQIVFQNPYDSLNPAETVSAAICRPLRLFGGTTTRAARSEVPALLDQVRLPARLMDHYPRELSGGERQRVAIARALACRPELLVCDEITSSLDVSVQAAILDLIASLRRELDLALLFITHDFGVVGAVADRILVLEDGQVRETGRADVVLQAPHDGYTQRLLAAIPELPITDRQSSS